MERLYGNTDLKASLAAGARERLPGFAPECMAEKYFQLYRDILEGRINCS